MAAPKNSGVKGGADSSSSGKGKGSTNMQTPVPTNANTSKQILQSQSKPSSKPQSNPQSNTSPRPQSNPQSNPLAKPQSPPQSKPQSKPQSTGKPGDSAESGLTAKKAENFSEWYTQVVLKSELADYSAVSGCMVIRPLGMAIWDNIRAACEPRLKKMGVKHAYFPLFIPESLLTKEAAHVEGFTPECAWVTQGGGTVLSERLAVRPTSEAIMYDSYSKWIRSYRDLPLKLMQWNNVVRWEFKHPTLLVRTREFLWVEGHTAFATKEEADAEIVQVMDLWKDVCENVIALPSLHGRKSESEKFAGAEFTESLEFFMPNGKVAQGPDAHSDGTNFAKAYDIKFLDKSGEWKNAWQNTWAITTRMIGCLVAMHSDDKGLVIPPRLAPTKAVIVPIIFDDTKEEVLAKARELQAELGEKFEVLLDDRDGYTAGYKFNHWELRGVPVRIELGPKDLKKGTCMMARRDTGQKEEVPLEAVSMKLGALLDQIQQNLLERARKHLGENQSICHNFDEIKKCLESKKLVLAPWCANGACEEKLKAECEGSRTLNIPFAQPKDKPATCALCGSPGKVWIYMGKSY